MKKKWWVIILAAGIAFLAWKFIPRSAGTSDGVYVVKVTDLQNNGMSAQRFSGVVEAAESVEVKRDDSKTVAEIYVQEGQQVNPNDPLFVYDTTSAANSIAMANLDIESFQNEISALNADIAELSAQRDTALEDQKYNYTAQIQQRQMDIRQAQYDIQTKQAEIAQYQHEIDNSKVLASIGGIIKTINEDGGTDANGNPLPFMVITETGNYRVKGLVDEYSVSSLTVDTPMLIRSRIHEDQTWTGKISQIETEPVQQNSNSYGYGMAEDSGNSASRYPFYVSLDDHTGLLLGQHVYIETAVGQKDGIWLDSSYLFLDGEKQCVWINQNSRLHAQEVTTGGMDENMQVEITDGLSLDDEIAWPSEDCTEGAKVITGV